MFPVAAAQVRKDLTHRIILESATLGVEMLHE